MTAMKVVDKWWSRSAPLFLGGALLVLTTMVVMLYVGQLQDRDENEVQAEQISSLAEALDKQREAAKAGGAEVVAPPAEEIKQDPKIIQGVRGDKGETGESGRDGAGGADGRDGSRGPSGSPGVPGPSGSPGEPGRGGADGSDGADGSGGRDGADGAPGRPGENGQDGVGQTGPVGPPGPSGPSGRDGVDGKDGADGESPDSIRIPIGPVTYVCTPTSSGSTDYTCSPEVGDGGPEASRSPTGPVQHQTPGPVHSVAILPAIIALRKTLVQK